MEEAAHELYQHFQATHVPLPPQDVNFQALAAEQVMQMGNIDPSQAPLATFLAILQLKTDHESKLARHLMSKTLFTTIHTVKANTQDITHLKDYVGRAEASQTKLQTNQTELYSQLAVVKDMCNKAYLTASETKQRSAKGNFIVSGEAIPAFTPSEDLYSIVFDFIFEKYEIEVFPNELKALHRLPNNRVIFSLHSRLPGQSFDKLIRATNSNPRAHIKVYISIQLFEPYAEHFYVARRLKFYKIITNYRLDENGNSLIALKTDTLSFKFTGVEQLEAMQIPIPQNLKNEISYRRTQIKNNEERSKNLNIQKALQQRTNIQPRNQNQTQPSRTTPSSSNTTMRPPYNYQMPHNHTMRPPLTNSSPANNTMRPQHNYSTPSTLTTTHGYTPSAPITTQAQATLPAQPRQPPNIPANPAVVQPSSNQQYQPATPHLLPGHDQNQQPSFRHIPPMHSQGHTNHPPPTYPHPDSFLTTPPPGDSYSSSVWQWQQGQQYGQSGPGSGTISNRYFEHSDPATHVNEEPSYHVM